LRSGIMAVCHRPAALVASDGMGGTVPSGEMVLAGDEGGSAVVVPGYGMGGTTPLGDESGRAAGLGSG
jgi:hypothetical protein